jgi:hypothetical protein
MNGEFENSEFHPLENFSINLSGTYMNGFPYTRYDIGGKAISEINSARQPDYFVTNFRLNKRIYFDNLFGSDVNSPYLELSLDIYNLLNRTVNLIDNDNTGQRMLNVKKENLSMSNWYREADYDIAESFSSVQYDMAGNRLYNKLIDFDSNGIITQDEKFQGYKSFVENYLQMQNNHQLPRTVFLNLTVGF